MHKVSNSNSPGFSKKLDLKGLSNMSCGKCQLQTLYDVLAMLSHLEELHVPNCLALDGIRTLAGANLQRLIIARDVYLEPNQLDMVVNSITSLQRLQDLEIPGCTFFNIHNDKDGALANPLFLMLLKRAPPSLRRALVTRVVAADRSWPSDYWYSTVNILLQIRSQRLEAVKMSVPQLKRPMPISTLCNLAQVLLDSHVVAASEHQMLQILSVARVDVSQGQELELPPKHMHALQTLMGRSCQVEVGELVVRGSNTELALQAALQGLEWLGAGGIPQALIVGECPGLRLHLRAGNGQLLHLEHLALPSLQQHPAPPPLEQPPSQQQQDSGATGIVPPAPHPPPPLTVPSIIEVLAQRVIKLLADMGVSGGSVSGALEA